MADSTINTEADQTGIGLWNPNNRYVNTGGTGRSFMEYWDYIDKLVDDAYGEYLDYINGDQSDSVFFDYGTYDPQPHEEQTISVSKQSFPGLKAFFVLDLFPFQSQSVAFIPGDSSTNYRVTGRIVVEHNVEQGFSVNIYDFYELVKTIPFGQIYSGTTTIFLEINDSTSYVKATREDGVSHSVTLSGLSQSTTIKPYDFVGSVIEEFEIITDQSIVPETDDFITYSNFYLSDTSIVYIEETSILNTTGMNSYHRVFSDEPVLDKRENDVAADSTYHKSQSSEVAVLSESYVHAQDSYVEHYSDCDIPVETFGVSADSSYMETLSDVVAISSGIVLSMVDAYHENAATSVNGLTEIGGLSITPDNNLHLLDDTAWNYLTLTQQYAVNTNNSYILQICEAEFLLSSNGNVVYPKNSTIETVSTEIDTLNQREALARPNTSYIFSLSENIDELIVKTKIEDINNAAQPMYCTDVKFNIIQITSSYIEIISENVWWNIDRSSHRSVSTSPAIIPIINPEPSYMRLRSDISKTILPIHVSNTYHNNFTKTYLDVNASFLSLHSDNLTGNTLYKRGLYAT